MPSFVCLWQKVIFRVRAHYDRGSPLTGNGSAPEWYNGMQVCVNNSYPGFVLNNRRELKKALVKVTVRAIHFCI